MYLSGISIDISIHKALDNIENLYLKERLLFINSSIQTGKSLYLSFKNVDFFENTMLSILKAREESGKLDLALQNINRIYIKNIIIL